MLTDILFSLAAIGAVTVVWWGYRIFDLVRGWTKE